MIREENLDSQLPLSQIMTLKIILNRVKMSNILVIWIVLNIKNPLSDRVNKIKMN